MVYLKQSLVILVVWVSVFIFLAVINNVLANFLQLGPNDARSVMLKRQKFGGGQQNFQGIKKFIEIRMLKSF
jgi:hypothetical protein